MPVIHGAAEKTVWRSIAMKKPIRPKGEGVIRVSFRSKGPVDVSESIRLLLEAIRMHIGAERASASSLDGLVFEFRVSPIFGLATACHETIELLKAQNANRLAVSAIETYCHFGPVVLSGPSFASRPVDVSKLLPDTNERCFCRIRVRFNEPFNGIDAMKSELASKLLGGGEIDSRYRGQQMAMTIEDAIGNHQAISTALECIRKFRPPNSTTLSLTFDTYPKSVPATGRRPKRSP